MNRPIINYHNFMIFGSHRSVTEGSGLLGCGIQVLDEWLKTFQMNVKSHSTTDTTAYRRLEPHHLFLMSLLTAIVFREENNFLCRLNRTGYFKLQYCFKIANTVESMSSIRIDCNTQLSD